MPLALTNGRVTMRIEFRVDAYTILMAIVYLVERDMAFFARKEIPVNYLGGLTRQKVLAGTREMLRKCGDRYGNSGGEFPPFTYNACRDRAHELFPELG